MQYLLMLYADEGGWTRMSKPEHDQAMGAYGAFTEALTKSGALKAMGRLQPTSAATTVRVTANGKSQVFDGPYADTKEQLGGFYLIEVANLDAALSWATRCPASSHGSVEVRPIWPRPE